MRTRNQLAVSRLPDFIAWAESKGWATLDPKSPFEAWRGSRGGITAIIHQRLSNDNGTPLTHLTTWGESEKLRQEWMGKKPSRNDLKLALERCLKQMELAFANPARLTHSESGMNAFAGAITIARKALGARDK